MVFFRGVAEQFTCVIHYHYVISRSWFDKINSWLSVRCTEMNINGAPVKSKTVQTIQKTGLKYGINVCFSLLKAPYYSTQISCFRLPQLFLSLQWSHALCTSWYHQFVAVTNSTAASGPAVELVTASNWCLCNKSQLVMRQDRYVCDQASSSELQGEDYTENV